MSPLAHIHLLAHDYPVALPTSPGHRNMPPTPSTRFTFIVSSARHPLLRSLSIPTPSQPLTTALRSRLSTDEYSQGKDSFLVQSRASIPTCRPATYMVGAPRTPPTGTSATSALRGTMRA